MGYGKSILIAAAVAALAEASRKAGVVHPPATLHKEPESEIDTYFELGNRKERRAQKAQERRATKRGRR